MKIGSTGTGTVGETPAARLSELGPDVLFANVRHGAGLLCNTPGNSAPCIAAAKIEDGRADRARGRGRRAMASVEELLGRVVAWAEDEDGVLAVALVGSQARGTARADSDVDLVILLRDPQLYLEDEGWPRRFGVPLSLEREDWGMVQALRVQYEGGPVDELGVTSAQWAATYPLDEGTRAVAAGGLRILYDPHGLLAGLMGAIAAWGDRSTAAPARRDQQDRP